MRDPIDQPGDGDPGIDHATDEVVAAWQDATPGKEPAAGADDFARMRDGFGELAATDAGDPPAG